MTIIKKALTMKQLIMLTICSLLSIDNALAIASGDKIKFDARLRAFSDCGPAVETVQYTRQTYDSPPREETHTLTTTTNWTGGCAEGKRDGHGVLTIRRHDSKETGHTETTEQLEGGFIKGQQLGLWCTTKFEFSINGQAQRAFDPVGCHVLVPGARGIGTFRKLADGRWQGFESGIPIEPQMFLAAGTLEALSANAFAAAKGAPVEKIKVLVHSPVFDGLVRGAKMEWQASITPIVLKDKRVAVLLSSQTIAELERFKRERQALIDASAGVQGKETQIARTRFIAASHPDHLLTLVAKILRQHAKVVQPVDDLAGLKKGGFDYAVIVDWKSLTRFDQLGQYQKFPAGDNNDWKNGTVPALAGDSLSGLLITSDLKAVEVFPARQYIEMKSKHAGKHFQDDAAYLSKLYSFFESAWGRNVDDLGVTGGHFAAKVKLGL